MNTPVGSLDAEKIAESVLLYAFTMAFPASPYESVFEIYHFHLIYCIVFLDPLCLYLYSSQKSTLCPYFTNIREFVAILAP